MRSTPGGMGTCYPGPKPEAGDTCGLVGHHRRAIGTARGHLGDGGRRAADLAAQCWAYLGPCATLPAGTVPGDNRRDVDSCGFLQPGGNERQRTAPGLGTRPSPHKPSTGSGEASALISFFPLGI